MIYLYQTSTKGFLKSTAIYTTKQKNNKINTNFVNNTSQKQNG